jgi:hypothetical protein
MHLGKGGRSEAGRVCSLLFIVRYVAWNTVKLKREWRKLHNEELNDLCSLPIIVRVVKSRRMRWLGHVACIGKERGVHRVFVGET